MGQNRDKSLLQLLASFSKRLLNECLFVTTAFLTVCKKNSVKH